MGQLVVCTQDRIMSLRFTAFLLFTSSIGVHSIETGTRAASRRTGCGCQCSNTVFKDKYGKINGNCKSSDRGAVWCYVDPRYSACSDLQRSERFNQHWSYQACATPDLDSYECRSLGFGTGSSNGGYNNGFNSGSNGGFNSGSNSGFHGGSSGSNNGFYGGSNSGFNSGSNNGFNSGSNNGFNIGSGSYPCRSGQKCFSSSGSNINGGFGSNPQFLGPNEKKVESSDSSSV